MSGTALPTAGRFRFVASDRTGRPWIYMDAPSLQGALTLLASRRRLQTYIRPSDGQCASALMECAGWLLNNAASSRLVIHARFDQPRSYLSCHQRSIAKATCAGIPFCSAVLSRPRRLRRWCRYVPRLVGLARGQQRPRQPRVLVGHRDSGDVVMPTRDEFAKPCASTISTCPRQLNQGSAPVNQQGPQVDIASLADDQELRLAAAGVLVRHQTDPRRELPRVLEVARVPGAGHQRAGGEGADSGDGFQPLADFAAAMPLLDLALSRSSSHTWRSSSLR